LYKKWFQALTACDIFQGIEQEMLNQMLQCLNPTIGSYPKGGVIARAGEPSAGLGIVLAGSVAVTKESISGHRTLLVLLGPGDLFGEMEAYAEEAVWPATVVAQTGSEVLFLPAEKIVGNCPRQCISHRTLTLNMLKILSRKAVLLNKKVDYLILRSLREKIGTYLLEQYRKTGASTFVLPLKRSELAEFLNVSRPSLSRELCRMRDEGLIEFHRSAIKIKDLEGLKGLVG